MKGDQTKKSTLEMAWIVTIVMVVGNGGYSPILGSYGLIEFRLQNVLMLGRGEVADEIGDEGHRVLVVVDGGHRLGLCVRKGDLRVRPFRNGQPA